MAGKALFSSFMIGGAHAFWYRINEYGSTGGISPSTFKSRINLYMRDQTKRPFFFQLAQSFVCRGTILLSRLLLITCGSFKVIEDDNYLNFLKRIEQRDHCTPLITVSNHRSVFDDPGVLGCILPLRLALIDRHIRWSICAEEICFQHNALLESFFVAGKTLPIFRGGGVNQCHLLDFARQAAAGDWLHIFPEGGVSQLTELGGRDSEDRSDIGSLKWGVAKLIAHSHVRPVVIPYYHFGMDGVMPMDSEKKLLTKFPQIGQCVTVSFGQELNFDDLIENHEMKYGPLWKYGQTTSLVPSSEAGARDDNWISDPSDFILYHLITNRIEAALVQISSSR